MSGRLDVVRPRLEPGPGSHSTQDLTTIFQPGRKVQVPSFGKSGRLRMPQVGKDSPGPGVYDFGKEDIAAKVAKATAVPRATTTSMFRSRQKRFSKPPKVGNLGPGQYSTPTSLFKTKAVGRTGTFGSTKRMGMMDFMKFAGRTTEAPPPGAYNSVEIPPVPKKRATRSRRRKPGGTSVSSRMSRRSARDMDEDELYGSSNTIFNPRKKLRPKPRLKGQGAEPGTYDKASTFARAATVGGGLIERLTEKRGTFSGRADKDALLIPEVNGTFAQQQLSASQLSATVSTAVLRGPKLAKTWDSIGRGRQTQPVSPPISTAGLPNVAPRELLSRGSPNPAGLFDPVAHHRRTIRSPSSPGFGASPRGGFSDDSGGEAGASASPGRTARRRRRRRRRRKQGAPGPGSGGNAGEGKLPEVPSRPGSQGPSRPGSQGPSRPSSRLGGTPSLPAVPSASSLPTSATTPDAGSGAGAGAASGAGHGREAVGEPQPLPGVSPTHAGAGSNAPPRSKPSPRQSTASDAASSDYTTDDGTASQAALPRGPRRSSASTWDAPGGGGGVRVAPAGAGSRAGEAFDPRASARVLPLGTATAAASAAAPTTPKAEDEPATTAASPSSSVADGGVDGAGGRATSPTGSPGTAPKPNQVAASAPAPTSTPTLAPAPASEDEPADDSSYDSDMFDVDPDEKLPGADILGQSVHLKSPSTSVPSTPVGARVESKIPESPSENGADDDGDDDYGSDEFDT